MVYVLPAIVIALAVVVAAVPWGLPGEATFILPFGTLLLVFLFSARRKSPVPAWVAFVAGLAADILTAGPLGYWALIYTVAHTMARFLAHSAPAETIFGVCVAFAFSAAIAGAVGWGVASLYYLRLIDWWPIALGTGTSVALSPLFAWMMRRSLTGDRYRPLEA